MNIDKNMLSSLAKLDDRALSAAITMIAAQSGVDVSGISFDKDTLASLRSAMLSANDEDIANAKSILEGYMKK